MRKEPTRARVKSSPGRLSLAAIVCIGSITFGFGCIFLALANIGAQPVVFAEATQPEVDSPSDMVDGSKSLYPVYPKEGDNIGSLSIPALALELPIIQGTGVDELKKGVGHFAQSVLPGEIDNCVLSGHRDTVFAKLGELKIGDQLIAQTSAGTFTYEIKSIRIVDKDDRTVIVPTDHAVLTLTTCYPFTFIGSAPDRYILTSDLVVSE